MPNKNITPEDARNRVNDARFSSLFGATLEYKLALRENVLQWLRVIEKSIAEHQDIHVDK